MWLLSTNWLLLPLQLRHSDWPVMSNSCLLFSKTLSSSSCNCAVCSIVKPGNLLCSINVKAVLAVASYADALWACHEFLPLNSLKQTFVGEEFVTSPKSVCVGGYACCTFNSLCVLSNYVACTCYNNKRGRNFRDK